MQQKPSFVARKKLIEVALPLDAINVASKREKSIRHGHPSTLHLWWARRPLAAARAVIFAQLVDDPSAISDVFPSVEAQERERQRLFRIIEELVRWENTTNEALLNQARQEIWRSWRRTCMDNVDHPQAKELFNSDILPAFHDPFAGGGSLPLEAQRLGFEAHASDLNPVAVLINKAMIEIPTRFEDKPSFYPESQRVERLTNNTYRGAQGLADDVRYYGKWMRNEAQRRIGHLYPKVRVTKDMAINRADLEPYVGRELTVIAWLWARTVKSPNPAFIDIDVPMISTFILSKKKGNEAYVEPVFEDGGYRFIVKVGTPPETAKQGTKSSGSGSPFRCLISGVPLTFGYIRSEAKAGRMGSRLMAIVAEGNRRRVYLNPSLEQQAIAERADPQDAPETWLPEQALGLRVQGYGMLKWRNLFTNRQLEALITFSNLVSEVQEIVARDTVAAGVPDDGVHLEDGGTGATAYGEAVGVYLGLAVGRLANSCSTSSRWQNTGDKVAGVFSRQAIPMLWDYAEVNVFSSSTQNWLAQISWVAKSLETLPTCARSGHTFQSDAASPYKRSRNVLISTDPPYYDNIGYADLSDFFYVWLRRTLGRSLPNLFATLAVPKAEELVANPYRHNGQKQAEKFFLAGMTRAMHCLSDQSHPTLPITIYYGFKQSETQGGGTASTGWETFLDAVIRSGLAVTGTWPVRTERGARSVAIGTNALASSIVLVCRPRAVDASTAMRREFQEVLRSELPQALSHLRGSNIAPVDLAQASIGPGMGIFTQYTEVLNADGSRMSVREALALINATLDELLTEQDSDFDANTRWALAWFEQQGYDEGEFGLAEQLSKAKNTSIEGLASAGIIESRQGVVRIFRPSELSANWDLNGDSRRTVWELTQHLIKALESGGEHAAANIVARRGSQAETARELAYRLYIVSERKKRALDALAYNGLVQSWPEIIRLAGDVRMVYQPTLAFNDS